MAIVLAPVANFTQFFNNDGLALSGGQLFTYVAGSTSSLQTTWSEPTGTTPNDNPMVLDSSGRLTAPIWIDDTAGYQFVLTQSDGTTVLMSLNNIGASGA